MSFTIDELRAEWLKAVEHYDRMIAFLDEGHKLRPAGASDEEATKASIAWREELVSWRKSLKDLLATYSGGM